MRRIVLSAIILIGFIGPVAYARPGWICTESGCRPAPVSSPAASAVQRVRFTRKTERGPVLTFLGNCRQRMQQRAQAVRSFFGGRR